MGAYQQHLHLSPAQHLIGHATIDPALQAGTAMRGHNNQVNGLLVGVVNDRFSGQPRFRYLVNENHW